MCANDPSHHSLMHLGIPHLLNGSRSVCENGSFSLECRYVSHMILGPWSAVCVRDPHRRRGSYNEQGIGCRSIHYLTKEYYYDRRKILCVLQ